MILSFFNKKTSKNLIKKTFLEIPVSETVAWKIPKFEIDSGAPGPTIFLTSGIHGDEISGNVILLKFCTYFQKNILKKGKLVALIGINQTGSKALDRLIPESQEDLNRLFPGKEHGTVGEKVAFWISKEIEKASPEIVIDIHNDYFFSTPYILLDPKSLYSSTLFAKSSSYALSSGLPVVQERETELETYKNSLSAICIKKNIASFTLESGPDKLILTKYVNQVFESLLNILVAEKMISKYKNFKKTKSKKQILSYADGVKIEQAGVLRYVAEPGSRVKRGDVIAKIYNEFGENLKNILALENSIVLGHSEKTLVEEGEEIYWFAN
jgi:predicted deacylase